MTTPLTILLADDQFVGAPTLRTTEPRQRSVASLPLPSHTLMSIQHLLTTTPGSLVYWLIPSTPKMRRSFVRARSTRVSTPR